MADKPKPGKAKDKKNLKKTYDTYQEKRLAGTLTSQDAQGFLNSLKPEKRNKIVKGMAGTMHKARKVIYPYK